MKDVLYLAAVVAFFGVMLGVVGLCRPVAGSCDYDTADTYDTAGTADTANATVTVEDEHRPVRTGHAPA
jgi:hypothetical protein